MPITRLPVRLWKALTRNRARTHADASDPRLRGRVYARPAGEVWAAVRAQAGATRGWTIQREEAMVLEAEARTRLWRFVDDVEVHVAAVHGRTRVDMRSASRLGGADLGANARRIARFLHGLDARLRRSGAAPTRRSR